MPGTSASHSIFFIASVIIALAVVGAATGAIYKFSEGIDSRGDTLYNELRTDIKIINDPEAVPYDDPNIYIYIKNTGKRDINLDKIVILVDGVNKEITDKRDLDGNVLTSPILDSTQAVNLTVNVGAGFENKDHNLMIIGDYGASDRFEFRIINI